MPTLGASVRLPRSRPATDEHIRRTGRYRRVTYQFATRLQPGLTSPKSTAFLRISTRQRAARCPLTAREAWDFISDWLEANPAWIPLPGPKHAEVFRRLTVDGSLQGNLVSDAHLAALELEHGVGVCSADSDFARFPELDWFNPLR